MTATLKIKAANTQYDVAGFITARFSPRSFDQKAISEASMNTIFEAASWAPSANNEQPWEYYYAHRGTAGFEKLWSCLMPGNQPWTKNAAVLVVASARKTFAGNGSPNTAAPHDLGMANAHLLLQARTVDIFGHPMGGFDKNKVTELLGLGEDRQPVCMIALGYLGEPELLEEPFLSRERAERKRQPVDAFVFEV